MQGPGQSRGAVQLGDVLMTAFLVIFVVITAPVWWTFIGMASGEADPFSSLLLQLFIPFIIVAIVLSVAVSARRGA